MAAAGRAARRASGRAWGRGRAECEGLGEGKALGTRWSSPRERWEDGDIGVSEVDLRVGSSVCGVSLRVCGRIGVLGGRGNGFSLCGLGERLGWECWGRGRRKGVEACTEGRSWDWNRGRGGAWGQGRNKLRLWYREVGDGEA